MQLRRRCYDATKSLALVLLDVVPAEAHHLDERVELPAAVGGVLLHSHADPAAKVLLKVGLGHQEVVEELLGHVLDVLLVDERVGHIERPPPDRDVRVLEAVDDGGAVALHSLHVDVHHALKRRQGDVADVVVAAEEEAAEDVDAEHAEAAFGLDGHDREDALVQDRVACVLRALGVRGDLRQDVVHLVAGVDRVHAEEAQQAENLRLQEGVRDTGDVVLGRIRVARGHNAAERADQGWDVPAEVGDVLGARLQQRRQQAAARDQNAMVPILQERGYAAVELVLDLLDLSHHPHGAERRLLPDVRVGRVHHPLDLTRERAAHLCAGDVAERAQREAVDVLVVVAHVVLDRVRHQHEHLGVLVEQLREAQVADALLRELVRGDELQALHLAEVRRVAHHVNEEELRHIPVPELVVVLLEGGPDERALAGDDGPLLRRGLAGPDAADQLPELDRHRVGPRQGDLRL
mmetsp:Transcript_115450/g.331356  ORF Transcript_115450/g.331356 Transcript_115450/m.331356 type:complete len:464 (+) Transcript_115450:494-1885(+)